MRVLITGGSGMIARKVAEQLKANGHEAYALSRKPFSDPFFSGCFLWNPARKTFDPAAFNDMDAIVHLAGAGIAEKKWTPERKREIIESRTSSASFLAELLRTTPNTINVVVAAAATGYYGNTGEAWLSEDQAAGAGFLAQTCQRWEQALMALEQPTTRLAILRIGFVIDRSGGALPVMARPVRLCVAAPYGSGKQYVSWIDSNDLSRMFLYALTSEKVKGIYNAVAPAPVTNSAFIKAIGKELHRPVWPFSVPSRIFKLLLGEQSQLVLDGQRVSSEKIVSTGFNFEYLSLEASLKHHLS